MSKESKKGRDIQINLVFMYIFFFIIIISSFVSLSIFMTANKTMDKNIAEAEELARPADIEIKVLTVDNCSSCFDINQVLEVVKQANVNIKSEIAYDINSPEGQELVQTYDISKAPTFIITGEVNKDASLKELWDNTGAVQNDDTFIFMQVQPPYLNVQTSEIKGQANLIYLTDDSCADCYDVKGHGPILQRFGFPMKDQAAIDISSATGRELVREYEIKLVPTIILQGDVSVYSSLQAIWSQVGTVEDDGSYVFRQGVAQMGQYKNISSGNIIDPRAQQ